MAKVVFTGWKYGMQKIAFTKLLQNEANLSLSEAKKNTDDLLEGKTITIEFESSVAARNICERAKVLGVICEVLE